MILFSLPRQVVKMTNVSTDEYFLCIDRVCNHVIFEKKTVPVRGLTFSLNVW